MSIRAYTFDRAKISAADSAKLQSIQYFNKSSVIKGYKNELSMSWTGLNLTISTGMVIVKGRFIEISEPEVLTLPANSTGYVTIRIDLGVINTSTGTPGMADYTVDVNQVKLGFQTTLETDDITLPNSLGKYDFVVCNITTDGSKITSVTDNGDRDNQMIYNSGGIHIDPDGTDPVTIDADLIVNTISAKTGSAMTLKGSSMTLVGDNGVLVDGGSGVTKLSSRYANGSASLLLGGSSNELNARNSITIASTNGSLTLSGRTIAATAPVFGSTITVDGANFVGTSSTANKLTKPVNVTLSGDAKGTSTLDGAADVEIPVTIPGFTKQVDSVTLDGYVSATKSNADGVNYVGIASSALKWSQPRLLSVTGDMSGSVSMNGASNVLLQLGLVNVDRTDTTTPGFYNIDTFASFPAVTGITTDSKGRVTGVTKSNVQVNEKMKNMNKIVNKKVPVVVTLNSAESNNSYAKIAFNKFSTDTYNIFTNSTLEWTPTTTYSGLDLFVSSFTLKNALPKGGKVLLGTIDMNLLSVNQCLSASVPVKVDSGIDTSIYGLYITLDGISSNVNTTDIWLNSPAVDVSAGSTVSAYQYFALDPNTTSFPKDGNA